MNHINDVSLVTNHKDMPQRKRGSQTQLSTYVPINAYIKTLLPLVIIHSK